MLIFSSAVTVSFCTPFISDDSWHIFMKRFLTSVQHITGQELEVKSAMDSTSFNVVEQELEELRSKVEELSQEVSIPKKVGALHVYKSCRFSAQNCGTTSISRLLRLIPSNRCLQASPFFIPSRLAKQATRYLFSYPMLLELHSSHIVEFHRSRATSRAEGETGHPVAGRIGSFQGPEPK
jgi:hypothetical protein